MEIPSSTTRRWLADPEVAMWLDAVTYGKADLRTRLESEERFQSYPALWELMWREAAHRKWRIAASPRVGTKTPDVLVEAPSAFALEVVTVFETFTDRQDRIADVLRRELNRVATDLVWSMHITRQFPYPTYPVEEAVARFRAGVMTRLNSGDRVVLCDPDGIVFLEPHPELTNKMTGVHMTTHMARWLANDDLLWEAVEEKAIIYRPETLGTLPLVVAVCVMPEHGFGLDDMVNALCGRWVAHWERSVATGQVLNSGADRPGGWLLKENREHVSAIVFAEQATYSPLNANVHVITNPFATHTIAVETFLPWPTTAWLESTSATAGKADWVGSAPAMVLR